MIGITGPPGAGKSTLLSALVKEWRSRGQTVAVLAVDPSSKRSGGSLLGDRARIEHDSRDDGVLIRSTAAGTMLGGLAPPTREAAQALAAAFDIVVVETVGVGQSETDVADLCDTVAVVVQPGSGDVLQFLKAGIMEVPGRTRGDEGRPRADRPSRAPRPGRRAARGRRARHARGGGLVGPAADRHRRPGRTRSTRTASQADVAASRVRARRLAALAEFTLEHGESALRALGGRREAEKLLAGLGSGDARLRARQASSKEP